MRSILAQGKDIVCICFSSALSTTYQSAVIAAQDVGPDYPDGHIYVVDSLSASRGQGLLIYLAVQKKREGLSAPELAQWVEDNKLSLCHWFTVDDLVYLKRGGRVSAAAAFVGGLLNIKPVLHVDNEGHLINMFKVRGRRSAIRALAQKFGELAVDPKNATLFISHGDCPGDAELLARFVKEDYGLDVQIITYVGPVIGSHSGPGTLAFFFVGKER